MKRLYMIGGPMGVGKTAACRQLQQLLDRSVFLDGDWCWDAHPFQVTEETREMVLENISFLLNSFLRCSAYDHVIFCWVLHRREIWEDLLRRLTEPYVLRAVSLVCTPETLRSRLEGDILAGKRIPDVLDRSLAYLLSLIHICSAVSPPMRAQPAWTQPSATPETMAATFSGTFLPMAM